MGAMLAMVPSAVALVHNAPPSGDFVAREELQATAPMTARSRTDRTSVYVRRGRF
jgi:hypothetical protein